MAHLNQQSTGITSLRHHALSLPVHRDKAMPGVLGLARLVVPRMESRGLGSRRIHKTRPLLLPFGSDNAPSEVQRRGAKGNLRPSGGVFQVRLARRRLAHSGSSRLWRGLLGVRRGAALTTNLLLASLRLHELPAAIRGASESYPPPLKEQARRTMRAPPAASAQARLVHEIDVLITISGSKKAGLAIVRLLPFDS